MAERVFLANHSLLTTNRFLLSRIVGTLYSRWLAFPAIIRRGVRLGSQSIRAKNCL
jgi:hypothetical protein